MMGRNHALQGMAGGLATLPWCPRLDAAHQAAWVATWTASALLLDWDTKRSMASRMWGPASGLIHEIVSLVAQGHRRLTHDLILAPLITYLAVMLAGQSPTGRKIVVAIVLGLATRAFLVDKATWFTGLCTLAVSIAGAVWIVTNDLDLGAGLPLAILGGVFVHLAGDAVTVDMLPMPVLWIFGSRQDIGLPLFRAGRRFETTIITPASMLLIAWLADRRYGWWSLVEPHIQPLITFAHSLH